MKFVCIMEQSGQGCDYTIGCGMTYFILEATTADEATTELIKRLSYEDYESGDVDPAYHCEGGEQEISAWRLFEVNQEYDLLPILHQWKKDFDAKENAIEKAEQEAKDRAKYEELKRKFG